MKTEENARDAAPEVAAIFGASGGIGGALCCALEDMGVGRIYAGAHSGAVPKGAAVTPFSFDLTSESSIADAAAMMADEPPQLVVVATGVLTLPNGTGPERSLKRISPEVMNSVFALNTTGPAIIAKHMLPLFSRDDRSVFASLSARVGSISDNGLGGWHSYRASKAALNMLLRNFAIEMARTHDQAIIVGLHPGTVDTALSKPFQGNLPGGQLMPAQDAARNLLKVIGRLQAEDSGHVLDFNGQPVPA